MAISLVQHASNTAQFTSGTSGTVTATFASNATSGNCLIAAITIQASFLSFTPSVSSVKTGANAENWAAAVTDTHSSFSKATIWADPNTGGGTTSVSVAVAFGATATTSESLAILVDTYEVSGLTTVSVVDKTSSSGDNGPSSTSWTSLTTATTTTANEFWVGVVGANPGANNTTQTLTGPSSPWTNETTLSTSYQDGGTGTANKFFSYQLSGFRIVSSTGTAVYNGTSSRASVWSAAIATLKGAAGGTSVSLTVAQVTIAAPAPGMTVSVPLSVAQVNVNALAPKLGAGPLSLSVAQVNVNARAPGLVANPVSLAVAQVNINARAPGVGPISLSLPIAQVNVNAQPFIIGKSFAITTAQVTITAYPPGISRPGTIEDTIVPLMATGVYSNV